MASVDGRFNGLDECNVGDDGGEHHSGSVREWHHRRTVGPAQGLVRLRREEGASLSEELHPIPSRVCEPGAVPQ